MTKGRIVKLTHDLALLAARSAAELDHACLGRAESFEATRALGAELEPLAHRDGYDPGAGSVFAQVFAATNYAVLTAAVREFSGRLIAPEAIPADSLPALRDRCIQVSDAVAHYARTWGGYRRRMLAA